MDFDLTEEQRLLQDSVTRLLADRYSFEARKGYLKSPEGWSKDLWRQYAELGLLGLPFAEEYGGFGGTGVEVMLVMQAFGRVLALEPFLSTVVLGGTAIKLAGSSAHKSELLPQIAKGSLKLAFAHSERQSRYDVTDVLTTARRSGDGWVLNGGKSFVYHGDSADKLIVSARSAGERDDPYGITLFLVDAKAKGVARRGHTMRDGQRAAEIALTDVAVTEADVLGDPGEALPVIERIVEAGIAATCGEVVGTMEAIHEMTLDYLKTREQFGQPIGRNQALQHRSAEMFMELEQGRSMAMLAAISADEEDPAERARAISMAKVGVGQSGKFVSQQGIQLHGGIGMTEEYAVGHYFRRVMTIEHMFGDISHHLNKLAGMVD